MTALQPEERARLNDLLLALADAFDGEGRPGGDAAAAALRAAQAHTYRKIRTTAEPGPILKTFCTQAGALPIAATVLAFRNLLSWWHWTGGGLEADISSSLYVAELVGPDGHIDHDVVRVGLLISDAATDYPISSHSGEETYLVISGVAEWFAGGVAYKTHAPGAFIHHPAWAPHGRRTLNEPFLGAWRWSGDLDYSSFKVDES